MQTISLSPPSEPSKDTRHKPFVTLKGHNSRLSRRALPYHALCNDRSILSLVPTSALKEWLALLLTGFGHSGRSCIFPHNF